MRGAENIPISLVGRLLAMSVFQMRLEVIRAGEWSSFASSDPALVHAMLGLLMDGLLMTLLVLLPLEALGLTAFVHTARIAAGEFVRCNNYLAVDAGLALGAMDWFGFERATQSFSFVRPS
jgi:hypothetical protein